MFLLVKSRKQELGQTREQKNLKSWPFLTRTLHPWHSLSICKLFSFSPSPPKLTRLFGFSFPFDFHLLCSILASSCQSPRIKSAPSGVGGRGKKLVRNKTCSNKIASWTEKNNSKESQNFYVSRLLLPLLCHIEAFVAACMPTCSKSIFVFAENLSRCERKWSGR